MNGSFFLSLVLISVTGDTNPSFSLCDLGDVVTVLMGWRNRNTSALACLLYWDFTLIQGLNVYRCYL